MITLTVGATTLPLPPDLFWEDEFAWTPFEKSETRSITGARIVQSGVKQGGRPITLRPIDDNSAWMSRAALDQIYVWAQIPGQVLTLSLRGESREVEFRSNEEALAARPVTHYSDVVPEDAYLVTLRFLET